MRMHTHIHTHTHTHTQVSSEAMEQEEPSQLQATSQAAEQPQFEVTFWQEVMDPNTNHVYYWNPDTNEVSWTLPANGVISNEVTGGMGTEQGGTGTKQGETGTKQGGTGMNNSTDGADSSQHSQSAPGGSVAGAQGETSSSAPQNSVKKTGGHVLVAKSTAAKKTAEIDMFEATMEESESDVFVGPAIQPVTQTPEVDARADVGADETNLSKKRKASPKPNVTAGGGEEPLAAKVDVYQTAKKPRLSSPGGGAIGGGSVEASVSAAAVESGTSTPPMKKQAEQMLRVGYVPCTVQLCSRINVYTMY